MEAAAIFALIMKGINVVTTLIEAEQSAEPALKALYDLASDARSGNVTQIELDETETLLDSLIADFNEPIEG